MTEQPGPDAVPPAAADAPPAPSVPAGRADLRAWVAAAAHELGLDPAVVDVEAVLDLARVAAHGVARPAAPLTTFLAGYALAAAGGASPRAAAHPATFDEIADRLAQAADRWDD